MIKDEQLKHTILELAAKFNIGDISPFFMSDPGLPETHKFWMHILSGELPKDGNFYASETSSCFWSVFKDKINLDCLSQKQKKIFLLIGLLNFYYENDSLNEEFGSFLETLINLNVKNLESAFYQFRDLDTIEALVRFIYDSFLDKNPDFDQLINKSDTGWNTIFFNEYPGDAWIRLMERFFPKNNEYASYIIEEIKRYKNSF